MSESECFQKFCTICTQKNHLHISQTYLRKCVSCVVGIWPHSFSFKKMPISKTPLLRGSSSFNTHFPLFSHYRCALDAPGASFFFLRQRDIHHGWWNRWETGQETQTKVNLNHILEQFWLLLNATIFTTWSYQKSFLLLPFHIENQNDGWKSSVKSVWPIRVSPGPVHYSAPSTREQLLFWTHIAY